MWILKYKIQDRCSIYILGRLTTSFEIIASLVDNKVSTSNQIIEIFLFTAFAVS